MPYKTGAMLLSLLAALLVALTGTAAAQAEAGPFLSHRAVGEKGGGEALYAYLPDQVQGEGGEQTLAVKLAGTSVEIASKSLQIKGIFYNNSLRGQAKLELKYLEPKLVKPVLKECQVKFGTSNTLKLFGHLAWTWNGEKKQLEEKGQGTQTPDWVFLPSEIVEGANEPPGEQPITNVAFKGSGCGVLLGTFVLEGGEVLSPKPEKVGEWTSSETLTTAQGKTKQHLWSGAESFGMETGLTLAHEPATMTSESKIKDPGQEVSLTEEITGGYFGSLEYPSHIEGQNKSSKKKIIEDGKDTVSCGESKFTGELQHESRKVALTPEYSKCTAIISGVEESAKVNTAKCIYELGGLEETGGKSETAKSTLTLTGCSAIKAEVEKSKCSLEVSAQGPLSGMTLRDITATGEGGIEAEGEFKEPTITSSCPGTEALNHWVGIVLWAGHWLWEWWTSHLIVPGEVTFTAGQQKSVEFQNGSHQVPIWLSAINLQQYVNTTPFSATDNNHCRNVIYNFNGRCSLQVTNNTVGIAWLVLHAMVFNRVVGVTTLKRTT